MSASLSSKVLITKPGVGCCHVARLCLELEDGILPGGEDRVDLESVGGSRLRLRPLDVDQLNFRIDFFGGFGV